MFSSVWLFFFTCTFLNVFNQHLSTHALHTQLHTSTLISTHKLQNAPAVSSVLCATCQSPHLSCLLKSVSLFLPFKFFDSCRCFVLVLCALSLFSSNLRLRLARFSSSWWCLFLPGLSSSSRQSLLLLLHLHQPPSLLPTAALCQPCCPGAASYPIPTLLTHSLLLFCFGFFAFLSQLIFSDFPEKPVNFFVCLFHYIFSAICWKLQIMMYTVNSNAL